MFHLDGEISLSVLRKSALVVAVSATAVTGVVGAGAAAGAAKSYGTLAYSPSTGRAVAAVGHPSPVAADAAAIRECGVYDCDLVLRLVDACGAIARGADGRFGWAAAPSRAEAEQAAVASLGESAPPFPDLGSAQPRAALVVVADCTANAIG
ncbi:DUF4189 domain-containing protein [Nocardia farcinica]|uniref:DUF4189 domain-containing protein n=1 Tax=Nocardia farcinica TaxID=37329 RepID=A0A0H5NF24_NOCFR|nr:DUF4189 domain-containing protein [Nocardia farcinica]MBF6229767.1 DUF4189 domain-containing protein [Nocardia farcinica]MBF6256588.1 DUF4189 domain-containing protein [Nocardia farcinica]MBF6266486.1 DUF4189 domain-containing protein [Nocardia farcinica]MBF6291371.1 DUF4189 domain-containing protein [Nocardia farcinica]